MDAIVQVVLSGLAMGGIYALVAFGFHLTFITSETLNFAQGSCVMLGAMLAVTLLQHGWPFIVVLVVVVLVLATFGALIEVLCVRHIKDRYASIGWIASTLGLAIVVDNVAGIIWGTLPIEFPSPLTRQPLHILGAGIYAQELLIPVIAIAFMIGLHQFQKRTMLGKSLKAVAFNQQAAELMGINGQGMVMLAYALSSAMAAIGGILIGPIIFPFSTMGLVIGLKAFGVAMIGGLGSAQGIITCALAFGVFEFAVARVFSTAARDFSGFLLIILVLSRYPTGLFGTWLERKQL
jgi:branched-chain amino acid transport system permease protein